MRQTRRQFVRTLFVATAQATVAGSLLPRNLFAADAKSGGLNFLVFGDWGRNGEKDQMDVAAQMAVAAKEIDAKFIISVGDNFYEHGVKSVDDPQWQTSFEKVYSAPSLQVPWHVVLGNHDYHGNCDAQIAYHKVSPRWNMPARYYTRTEHIDDQTAVEFFFLDTTPMKAGDDKAIPLLHLDSQDNGKQLAWFEAALAASTAPWKIVIAHHPVYSGGEHGDTPYLVKHVLPLLEKHQVQAWFNGHDHDLQHLQAGKVNLFCSGAGSKPRKTGNNLFLIGISFSLAWIQVRQILPRPSVVAAVEPPAFKQPETLNGLLALSPVELEHCDIARMNLLCAEALPGAENLNVEECLATLDQWAQHIKAETDRNHHHFKEDPAYYSNSEAFYKMLMMAVVLYEDYGVRYNPKLITSPEATAADDHFFADSRDMLIHGLVGPQHLGTCSSMPILYIALGRRLDYPLKLVKAKGHLFMRWDSPTEKFDMDATGKGLDMENDEFYKKWPFPLSEADIQAEDYLKSLSTKEELSVFLSIRGECQTDNGQLGDALASFSLAYKLVPTWRGNQVMVAQARQRLARPVMLVQQQPMNLNIPTDPNPPMQQIQPGNLFQTP